MVSFDHFRQELLAQLGRAATGGRIDFLINSVDLVDPSGAVPIPPLAATPCKPSLSRATS